MDTKVINFIAAPSTGKSLMSALVYAELKMMHKSTEIIPEYAKWLVYTKDFDTLNDQWKLSTEQYKKVKILEGKVEYIVGDSGLLTGLYYNRKYTSNHSDKRKTASMIMDRNNEFNNIYIYLRRNDNFPYENNGRVHSEEESRIIEQELLDMLHELNINFKSFTSDRIHVKDIVDYILEF